jgi:Leucine-rich repeat (LRR) protein
MLLTTVALLGLSVGCTRQPVTTDNAALVKVQQQTKAEIERMRHDLDKRLVDTTKQLQADSGKLVAEAEKRLRAENDQRLTVVENKLAEAEKRAEVAEGKLADAKKELAATQLKLVDASTPQPIPAPEPPKPEEKPAFDEPVDEKSVPPAVARIVSIVKKLGGSVEFKPGTTEIVKVDLSNSKVIDIALSQLKSLGTFKILDLSNTRITNAALHNIAGLTGLEEVRLGGTTVNPQQAERQLLQKVPKLKIVWEPPPLSERRIVELVRQVGGEVQLAKDAAMSEYYISEVNLPDNKATDEMLGWLRGLTRIKSLTAHSLLITDVGMAHISKLSSLEDLRIDSSQVTDDGLRQLSGLTKLRGIGLHGTKVTDAGLIHLKDMKDLEYVYVGETPVVGTGFGPLTLKSLRRIDISSAITDDGLAGISGMDGLEELIIQAAPDEVRLTPMVMKAFKAKHPKAAIISWDGQERAFDGTSWIPRRQ